MQANDWGCSACSSADTADSIVIGTATTMWWWLIGDICDIPAYLETLEDTLLERQKVRRREAWSNLGDAPPWCSWRQALERGHLVALVGEAHCIYP